MFKIDLTQEEGDALLKLLHYACQAKGLEVAGVVSHFDQKIKAAFSKAKENIDKPKQVNGKKAEPVAKD